jgi:hypothetical protein
MAEARICDCILMTGMLTEGTVYMIPHDLVCGYTSLTVTGTITGVLHVKYASTMTGIAYEIHFNVKMRKQHD